METAKCNSTYRRYNDYLYDLEVLENIRLYDDYEAYKQDRLITLQTKKPMPTLESKREKLSRLVSQDYRISYNKELELRTNESLLALDKPKELENDIDGVFVSDKVCSTYFTYGHTFSDVQSIIEKYDLDSGEEVFKRGLGETEALTGSVEKKRGMQLTDAQIESMGTTAPVDTDMEQPSLYEDEEDKAPLQLGLYNTDNVTDIQADISPIVGAEPEPGPEFVVNGSSDLVEDNELEVTGVAETEPEPEQPSEAEPEQPSETEQAVNSISAFESLSNSGYSEQASEPSESNDNSIEGDAEEYLDDEDDEEYLDDEDEGAEEEDSEAPEEAVSEQVAEPTEELSEDYGDDDEEYLDDEDLGTETEDLANNDEDLGTEAEDLADTNNDVPVNQPSPVEQSTQVKGYLHPQEQAHEPFNLDTSDVNIDFNGNNGRASPLHQPVQPVQNRADPIRKADSQGVTDEEKHDLRLFLRHHPRCEYSLVSQYFSKKEIQDNITRGKIIKRGKTLRLI